MYKWILPSLGEILTNSQSNVDFCSSNKAQEQWRFSLAACEQLLLDSLTMTDGETKGLVLAAPAPVFSQPKLAQNLQTVTFTAKPFNSLALMPFEMSEEIPNCEFVLPLLEADPLTKEQFCVVFTEKFKLVLVLAEDDEGKKTFLFSFDPHVVDQVWRTLAARIALANANFLGKLEELVQKYDTESVDCHSLMQFSRLLLQQLPEEDAAMHPPKDRKYSPPVSPYRPDIELLQAFAHEVRTPLTTIRTMTRLLLKQDGLSAKVLQRLEIIDRECTEQIDRMELLFRAAELETSAPIHSPKTQLTAMSLDQVLQQSIPRWQQAASRRNLSLDVVLPKQLPTVVSNPLMLDRILTGLMESFTRNLPPGSHIQVQVIPAGDQLKLQLLPQPDDKCVNGAPPTPPVRKALGQLLIFQPETGTISLNIAATKHLFQAIGGKLIVRQRPEYGEVLTIFLPLEVEKTVVAKN